MEKRGGGRREKSKLGESGEERKSGEQRKK